LEIEGRRCTGRSRCTDRVLAPSSTKTPWPAWKGSLGSESRSPPLLRIQVAAGWFEWELAWNEGAPRRLPLDRWRKGGHLRRGGGWSSGTPRRRSRRLAAYGTCTPTPHTRGVVVAAREGGRRRRGKATSSRRPRALPPSELVAVDARQGWRRCWSTPRPTALICLLPHWIHVEERSRRQAAVTPQIFN
jgi:hypothetical protein